MSVETPAATPVPEYLKVLKEIVYLKKYKVDINNHQNAFVG